MENKKNADFSCEDCGFKKTVSVNEIKAKPSKTFALITGLFLILGTLIVLYYFRESFLLGNSSMGLYYTFSGLLLPLFIYVILNRAEINRVKAFNRTYINDNTN